MQWQEKKKKDNVTPKNEYYTSILQCEDKEIDKMLENEFW